MLKTFEENTVQGEYKVVDIDTYDDYDRYTIKQKFRKFHFYGDHQMFEIGDVIFIKGDVISYRSQSQLNGFDQKLYYLSHHIYGKIKVESYTFVRHEFHVYQLRNDLISKTDAYLDSDYMKAFIFGEKIQNENIKDIYESFDILYLFTISGMHVYILVELLKKGLFILNLSEKFQHGFIMSLYVFLCYLTAFSFSILRLLIIYLLKICNRKFELNFQHLDLIFVTFLIMLFFHVGYIYHLGFLITFLILIALELCHPFTQKHQGYIQKLIMSIIVFVVLLPFFGEIKILQILLLPIIILIITTGIFPLAMFSLISKNFNILFTHVVTLFEKFIQWISEFQLNIYVPKFNIYLSIIYYACIIWVLFSNQFATIIKRIFVSFIIVFSILFYQFKAYEASITFLDVGQGDTAFIQSNGCHAVIDSYQNTFEYLKNRGIRKIDYLFLTHSHEDHVKEAITIHKNLDVKQIVLSEYDMNYPNFNQKSIYVKAGSKLTCGHIEFNILGPIKHYENGNNQSLVIQFDFDYKTFLFTGDIEEEAEHDLIEMYQERLKSDVIKVPHHGSITSSSKLFLEYVNPSYAIISLKTPNSYQFPHDEVIKRYQQKNIVIYQTDIHGSIIYHSKRRKEKWELYLSI